MGWIMIYRDDASLSRVSSYHLSRRVYDKVSLDFLFCHLRRISLHHATARHITPNHRIIRFLDPVSISLRVDLHLGCHWKVSPCWNHWLVDSLWHWSGEAIPSISTWVWLWIVLLCVCMGCRSKLTALWLVPFSQHHPKLKWYKVRGGNEM